MIRTIQRRDFEPEIQDSFCAIACTIKCDDKSQKCLQYMEDVISKKYPDIKFLNYDLSCDMDITEMYTIENIPTILIFKNNVLINKIVYDDIIKNK